MFQKRIGDFERNKEMGMCDFLVLLSIFLVLSMSPPVCGNAELRALMELKASLDPGNRVLGSWSDRGDPCSGFEGVVCNDHLKVANISLSGKRLSGKVSKAVARLECLSGLYLNYNSLTGVIPKEITNMTELSEIYLNVNNISGNIPSEIQNMASLQVLQLSYNQLTGNIPTELGSLEKLSVVGLQNNRLTGAIPSTLHNLINLKRVYLSFNLLTGAIPATLAMMPQLEILDVRNNSLSGAVPHGLERLKEFQFTNNQGLCGNGFFGELRACTNQTQPFEQSTNLSASKNIPDPEAGRFHPHCNQSHCSDSSRFRKIAIAIGVVTAAVVLAGAAFLIFSQYRRKKQKIGSSADSSDDQTSSIEQAKEFRCASPLVSLEYSNGYPLVDGRNDIGFSQESLESFRFNLEEIESATQYFSEVNLLVRTKFSSVYKGILRDGSVVAIRSLNVTSCKSEETEFVKGLNLLTSLRHENLDTLRGFCCSRARGECFLVYDFAPRGSLSQYLDVEEGSNQILDWSTRVSVISGIAKGIGYLHSSEANKSALVHQNISVEKVLLDAQYKPLIMDSCLSKILAEDAVYSVLKVSAAMGYLAPEYITTGRFTDKSDVYAFGVIVLQILSGKQQLSSSLRVAAEAGKLEDFVDANLKGEFSEMEADKLAKIAMECTREHAEDRPTMAQVALQLAKLCLISAAQSYKSFGTIDARGM